MRAARSSEVESPFDPTLLERSAGFVVYPPPTPTLSLKSSGLGPASPCSWARASTAGRPQTPRSKSRIRRPVLRDGPFLEVTAKRASLDQVLITETSGDVPTLIRAHKYAEYRITAIRYSPKYMDGKTLPAGLKTSARRSKFRFLVLPKAHRGFASATIPSRMGVATPDAPRHPAATPGVLALQGRLSPILLALKGEGATPEAALLKIESWSPAKVLIDYVPISRTTPYSGTRA